MIIILAVGFTLFYQAPPLALAKSTEITIDATLIPFFKVGDKSTTRFGDLRFISGIEYTAKNAPLGGISGIRVLEGGTKFLSVSDKGAWFTGTITRDAHGNILGIESAKTAPLRNTKGEIITTKRKGDAEGIEIIGDQVFVSFERKSRIYSYPLDLANLNATAKSFRPAIKKIKMPDNNGLEAISVLAPPDLSAPLNARMAVFSEHALDANGNIRAFISKKKKWKEFAVRAIGKFKITDATLLPDGDIAILERQFSISTGPAIRIRRLKVSHIKAGALVGGDIIFEADIRYQIDNLEGISAWVNAEGQSILTLVSDDNFSIIQRNLMLEFELLPK